MKFNPARLTEARQAAGLTMAALSERIGVTRQAVSIFEKGSKSPTYENVSKISKILEVGTDFFYSESKSIQEITTPSHFRSFKTTAKKSRTKAQVQESWFAEFSQALLADINYPGANIYRSPVDDFTELTLEDIESIALEARKFWKLGAGPISNMTRLLESNGVFVAQLSMDRQTQAFSNWRGNLAYIITERQNSNARHRFNLAHELGHLIMHTAVSDEDHEDDELVQMKEDQANFFAGAFLCPRQSILQEFTSCSLDALIHLKRRWGISIAALTVRARSLGLITENQSIYVFKQLATLPGGRKSEPLDKETPKESSKLISDMIDFLERKGKFSKDDIARILPLPAKRLAEMAAKPEAYFLPSEELPSNVISFQLRK
ncbi:MULTISPECIES: XRE family transcriptional regulator [unclassified Pseudomonas]|uniref:XRE family transcriptional regulator n=1 Tax=unclassified Pseudomonas TaxID=196821 RepID=UPI000C87ED2E|nr:MULTISPECIES: XRE family transcriptional regulator [unclassified Pseudomonas]PNA03555.1 DNA-binding protein [Pseudomonas sp. FW305-BF15]PNB79360.1 DNA-binding protein [Pseudomonas sp. FW305-BF6]